MALHVLAYNLTRVMNIMGTKPLPGGDEGIVAADMRPFSVAEPPRRSSSGFQTEKLSNAKNYHGLERHQSFRHDVFTRPRP
jgi:hypothetical protein